MHINTTQLIVLSLVGSNHFFVFDSMHMMHYKRVTGGVVRSLFWHSITTGWFACTQVVQVISIGQLHHVWEQAPTRLVDFPVLHLNRD